MGPLIRSSRISAGLSQGHLVRRLAERGIQLSRSHLSNIERGDYEPREDQLIGIDAVLELDGELVAEASSRLGVTIGASVGRSIFSDVGHALRRRLVDDPWPAAREDFHPVREFPADGTVVIDGPAKIRDYVIDLLNNLITPPTPDLLQRQPVRLSGFVAPGLGSARVDDDAHARVDDDAHGGLPLEIRNALRRVMEHGWEVHHFVRLPENPLQEAYLARLIAPLIPCSQYRPLVVADNQVGTVESALVVPGVAAVQFFSRRSAGDLDAAIVFYGRETQRVWEDRMQVLGVGAQEFVERFERLPQASRATADPTPTASLPDLTGDEIRFRRILLEMARVGGKSDFLIGGLPNCTEPTHLYSQRVKARRDASSATPGSVWDEVIDIHRALRERFLSDVRSGELIRVLLREKDIIDWIGTSSCGWAGVSVDAYRQQIDDLRELARANPNLQIAIFQDVQAQPRKSLKWEVRSGERGSGSGAVLIQTTHHPVSLNEHDRPTESEPQDVDLRIRFGGVVKAFSALFDDLWRHKDVERRPEEVFGRLAKLPD